MEHQQRDFTIVYTCQNCNNKLNPPKHCGKAMKIHTFEGAINWVCWKGVHQPCCGRESSVPYEGCCDSPNLIAQLKHILM